MKVVQIITRMDDVGGAQMHVKDLSSHLKKSGHDVFIITGSGVNCHPEIEELQITMITSQYMKRDLKWTSDIKAILEIRKIIKDIQPDLIATHSSKAGIIGRVVGRLLGIPTIFTAHGWSFTEGVSWKKKGFYRLVEKVIGWISTYVITVSEYDRQLALKHKVLPAKKLITIHNGVYDHQKTLSNQSFNDHPNMIMVARFAPPKQQLYLLKALAEIKDIPWHLTFAGDGPLLNQAKEYVEEAQISERVSFLGNRRDVVDLMQEADLFVLISDWEGLPLSILEAMRGSLPIIASDVGGVKETIIHKENGYLVPKDDGKALQKGLLYLLTNRPLRQKMGNVSREIFEEKFKFEEMYEKTFSLYEEMIQVEQLKGESG